jgi:nitrogen fixation NifU-like protein
MWLIGHALTDQDPAFPFKNSRYHLSHRFCDFLTAHGVHCDQRMSPELIDHFRNPRNVGELPPPALTVQVENPVCGDILRLSAEFHEGRIIRAGYKARGCTASIAAGSALTEIILGRSTSELPSIGKTEVEAAVGGLSNESKHAAILCADALRALAKARSAT